MNNQFERLIALIGEDAYKHLTTKHILLCGLGGVGGYALEVLVRQGIGRITVVDYDIIDSTNLNRQILATIDTIGLAKVEVAKKRALSINPNVIIETKQLKITSDMLYLLDGDYDYIIDCIDDTKAKISLIEMAFAHNIKIISATGTATKLDPKALVITTLAKTHTDPLAKKLRYHFKDNKDLLKTLVLFSTEPPVQHSKYAFLPSSVIVPSVAGIMIGNKVCNDLIDEVKK